jgi:hypothetical protein
MGMVSIQTIVAHMNNKILNIITSSKLRPYQLKHNNISSMNNVELLKEAQLAMWHHTTSI